MVTVLDDPTAAEFDALFDAHGAVVVDFYATWCGPCKVYSPRFAQAAREARRKWPQARVAFVKVDIDRHQELARRFGIQSVPTTVVLQRKRGLLGGEKVAPTLRRAGAIAPPDLQRIIEGLVARHAA